MKAKIRGCVAAVNAVFVFFGTSTIQSAQSKPVRIEVASAFHPSLATVGVLLAVFGYAVGTIAAIGCTILMELAAVS